ncbi:hypothetical protein ACIQZB_35715 [Streptomyces sp. NPDC097727]|uniref:hypothetical protein n=1 Tax=Streptomyces sp. NPDC097727 TaxID=3366092 RepID=UPI003810A6E6
MNAPEVRSADPVTPEPADPGAVDRSAADGRPLLRLMPMLTVANAAMYMVCMGIGAVPLPVQVELVDPADKVADFGLVSGASAIFATPPGRPPGRRAGRASDTARPSGTPMNRSARTPSPLPSGSARSCPAIRARRL